MFKIRVNIIDTAKCCPNPNYSISSVHRQLPNARCMYRVVPKPTTHQGLLYLNFTHWMDIPKIVSIQAKLAKSTSRSIWESRIRLRNPWTRWFVRGKRKYDVSASKIAFFVTTPPGTMKFELEAASMVRFEGDVKRPWSFATLQRLGCRMICRRWIGMKVRKECPTTCRSSNWQDDRSSRVRQR